MIVLPDEPRWPCRMTISPSFLFVSFAILAGTAFSLTGCSRFENTVVDADSGQPVPESVGEAVAEIPATALIFDGELGDYRHAQRAHFSAVLSRLSEKLAEDARRMDAGRSRAPGRAATDWDLAMKELADARSALEGKIADMYGLPANRWQTTKHDLGLAWWRTQVAHEKLKKESS